MTWWDAVPVLLAVLVVVLAPGGALLAALGVRGLPLLALAPAASVAVLGGGAVLAGFAGVAWQLPVALAAIVVGVGIAALLRRFVGVPAALREPLPRHGGRIFAVGAIVAGLVGAAPLARGIGRADRPPQAWDSVFHLNAVRYVEDTGNASTFLLGGLVNPDAGRGFYPAGWHVLAGTVVDGIGADPAVVANIMTLVLAGVVLPLGTALATRALMPQWRWAAGVGAVAGSVFASLPAMMVTFGTLWPNAWATAMLPAVLGASLMVLRRTDLLSWTAVVVAAAGASLLHPSFVFGAALLGAPLFLQAGVRRWLRLGQTRRRRVVIEIGAVCVAAVAAVLAFTTFDLLAAVRGYVWAPSETMAQAVGEAILDAPLSRLGHGIPEASWLLGGLLFLGVLRAAADRDQRAWVWTLLLAVAAFAISAGAPVDSAFRDYVTGFWYNDPVRLAGHLPVAAAPLVAIGVGAVAEWLERHGRPLLGARPSAEQVLRIAAVPVVVLTFLALTGGYAEKRQNRMTFDYYPDTDTRILVTPAEEDLLRSLDDRLPADAVVLADPFGGGSLAYALGDRRVVFPHMTGTWPEAALEVRSLMPDLDDPRVCAALDELAADYLYVDSRPYFIGTPTQLKYENLDRAPMYGVRLIERAGSAALYEITACD